MGLDKGRRSAQKVLCLVIIIVILLIVIIIIIIIMDYKANDNHGASPAAGTARREARGSQW